MQIGNLKEKILFARLKNRDRQAFIKAYDLYIEPIYRFIYFKVGGKEEAQDLTSAVFLKTWNYIQNNSLKDRKTLKALIYKIARTTVIDFYRENSVKKNILIGDETVAEIDLIDERQDLVKKTELDSDISLIEKKLPELKDEYREIIILRFIEELSISEIAEILDKSKGNIRILTYRALKALRELLESK